VIRPDDTLVTARLSLRRFTWADLDWLIALNADARVMAFLGGVKDRATVEMVLRTRILDYYDQHPGLGIWATVERDTGRHVGFHVLNNIQGETDIQVGYALVADAWGKGYATEMCRRILHYGFATLQLPRIVAITNLDHVGSQRVLLKCGLRRNGERVFTHPAYADQGSMAWFEADRIPWLDAHGARAPA
jgi:RimJ/RimL family protein N-acetyltransferase